MFFIWFLFVCHWNATDLWPPCQWFLRNKGGQCITLLGSHHIKNYTVFKMKRRWQHQRCLSVCECSGLGERLRLRRSDGLISCYHGADVLPFRLSVGEIHTAPSKQLLILFPAMHSRPWTRSTGAPLECLEYLESSSACRGKVLLYECEWKSAL